MKENVEIRPWDELIPDALGLIFKNLLLQEILTVIPRVWKSWRKAVIGPYCWQDVDIEQWSQQCQPETLDRMLQMLITRSSGSLRKLSVTGLTNDQSLSFIADNAKSLKTLRLLAYLLISTEGVLKVLENCPELELLDVRGCWIVKFDENLIKKYLRLKVVGPLVVDYIGMKGWDDCSTYSGSSGYLAWDFVAGNVDSDFDDEISDGDWEDDQSMEDVEMRFYDGFDLDDAAFDWPLSP